MRCFSCKRRAGYVVEHKDRKTFAAVCGWCKMVLKLKRPNLIAGVRKIKFGSHL